VAFPAGSTASEQRGLAARSESCSRTPMSMMPNRGIASLQRQNRTYAPRVPHCTLSERPNQHDERGDDCAELPLQPPWRADANHLPHNEPEIETAMVGVGCDRSRASNRKCRFVRAILNFVAPARSRC
jgi:hypothetical protein